MHDKGSKGVCKRWQEVAICNVWPMHEKYTCGVRCVKYTTNNPNMFLMRKHEKPQSLVLIRVQTSEKMPKGPFGWRSGKLGGWKISGRMEKWKDRKYLVFPYVCLVGGMEKWEGGKLFCLVEKKSGRIENVVYINWLLYPCYIIDKK